MKSRDCSKKLILFDFGVILTGLSKQRCIDALEKVGCGRIAYYVDECRQEDLFHELEIGGSIEAFCDEARRQSSYTDNMGIHHPCTATNEEICWAWNELLTGVPAEKLRMIHHLRHDLGYQTAILSNTNEIHWQKSVEDFFTIAGKTVNDYFDHIFLSCRMNKVKPDLDIYEEVKQTVADSADELFFIDDSIKNCRAAERCGIRTMHDPKGTKWMTYLLPRLTEKPKAAIIGNFDGVHKGHRHVINTLINYATKRDLEPVIITFNGHPRSVLQPDFVPQMLTTIDERANFLIEILKEAGIENAEEHIVTLDFNKAMAEMPARTFMEEVLHEQLNVRLLLLGYDNRFGARTPGEGFADYEYYGSEAGIEVIMAEPIDVDETRVSSSAIRKMLIEGNIADATRCLGHDYTLTGSVVHGYEEGRKLGFPTANILPIEGKLLPANGVYEAEVRIEGEQKVRRGVTNIGTRPTFNGDTLSIETHIIGFIGNIYGKQISITLLSMIRPEMTFSSVEELRKQIEKDISVMR